MSFVRRLSVIFVLAALAFSVEIAFDRDPGLEQASRRTVATGLETIRFYVVAPGTAVAVDSGRRFLAMVSEAMRPAAKPVAQSPAQTAAVPSKPRVAPPPARPVAPTAPAATAPEPAVAPIQLVRVTPKREPPPILVLPEAPPVPVNARASVSPAELVRVTMRLKDNLTKEMLENFSLFLYVSKAEAGPLAQRMYVFKKDDGGNLAMLYNFPASTGREKDEIALDGTRQPSYTPQGYYQLDPNRMYKNHYSGQWHQPMPYSMFFNWENKGLQTGLAIHAATGIEITQLGSRASAGCIRIAPEHAAMLFNLIRTNYKGLAPRFAYDRRTATMSNQGVMMHDAAGNLKMTDGYKVLVFVENYGGENVVAALF